MFQWKKVKIIRKLTTRNFPKTFVKLSRNFSLPLSLSAHLSSVQTHCPLSASATKSSPPRLALAATSCGGAVSWCHRISGFPDLSRTRARIVNTRIEGAESEITKISSPSWAIPRTAPPTDRRSNRWGWSTMYVGYTPHFTSRYTRWPCQGGAASMAHPKFWVGGPQCIWPMQ